MSREPDRTAGRPFTIRLVDEEDARRVIELLARRSSEQGISIGGDGYANVFVSFEVCPKGML